MRVLEMSPIMRMYQKVGALALATTAKEKKYMLSSVGLCLPVPGHL